MVGTALALAFSSAEPANAAGKQELLEAISIATYRAIPGADEAELGLDSTVDRWHVAELSVGGLRFRLQVVECTTDRLAEGIFKIYARQDSGKNAGELWISSSGSLSRSTLLFATDKPRKSWVSEQTPLEFDGRSLSWRGHVLGLDGSALMELQLTCPEPTETG